MTGMGDLVDPGAGPRWDDGADGVAATPAMPLIRSYEQNLGAPCPLQDGASPTLGWQWRADKKGGRAFGLITRTLSGSDKLREAIPLTQEGWAQAWDVLARLYPDRAAGARAVLAERAVADRARQEAAGREPGAPRRHAGGRPPRPRRVQHPQGQPAPRPVTRPRPEPHFMIGTDIPREFPENRSRSSASNPAPTGARPLASR
jgi:hypothetical protein